MGAAPAPRGAMQEHHGSALAVPAYRWYWASQLVSGVGTWSQVVAQSWLVLQLTGSPLALGTVTTLQFLPMLVFPLLGGVVADRVPRRRLLLVAQVAALGQALVLGALVETGTVQYWEVAALAFLLGLTNAFGNPAQQALVPELVGPELVGNAVALNSIQFNLARLVGGAVGGLAVAALGISAAVFLNAASFVPVIVVLAMIRPAHAAIRRAGPPAAVAGEIGSALRYAARTPGIRRVLALFGVVGLFGFNWAVAVPLLAVSLGAGADGLGALMSALGAGSLGAGIVLMRSHGATERRLVLGGLAMGAIIVLLGLSSWYAVSLALMVAAGLAGITASVSANTLLQLRTPDELRGRVMSLYVMLLGGTTPIGALLLGGIAQTLGIRDGLVVFGALTIAGLLAVLVIDRAGARAPGRDAGGR
jgi:MFS family permease